MASQGPMATTLVASQRHVETIGLHLFEIVGDTVLLAHSAGGPCGWALSAIGGPRVKAIVAVEPLGCQDLDHPQGRFSNGLCAAEFGGAYDPFDKPIAVITGQATWMRETNSKAVAYLQKKGAPVEHIWLEDRGIFGNGHMMVSEKNSDAIASLINAWIAAATAQ